VSNSAFSPASGKAALATRHSFVFPLTPPLAREILPS